MYCFQNVQTLCNFFPFLLSLKVSNQSFKNGSHLPFSEILDDLAKTSLSPPWIVVDRHVGPHVVQGVVGVAVVVVPVVIRVLNRVLRCVGRADRRSVVVCVGECHIGGGIWGKSDFHSHSIAVSCLKETSWGHVIIIASVTVICRLIYTITLVFICYLTDMVYCVFWMKPIGESP